MQAMALLLVASTMGGDFPTNDLLLPPAPLTSSGESLLDQARRATAATASDTRRAIGNSARRTRSALTDGVNSTRNKLRLAGGTGSMPKTRVAQAQYQQQGGLPQMPIDGLVGPGNGAASDPTRAYGSMQNVPPYNGSNNRGSAAATTNGTAQRGAATGRASSGMEFRPAASARQAAPALNYPTAPAAPVGVTANRPSASAAPGLNFEAPAVQPLTQQAPLAAAPQITNNGTAYAGVQNRTGVNQGGRNQVGVNRGGNRVDVNRVGLNGGGVNLRDPVLGVANGVTTGVSNAVGNVGNAAANAADAVGNAAANTAGAIGDGMDRMDDRVRRTGSSYFLTLLALFASIGLNMYLGWIAWDTYNRYQDLVADMRTTGTRRERRRERRRFSDSPAAAASAY